MQRLVGAHEGLAGLDDDEAVDERRHLLQVHSQERELVVEHHQIDDPALAAGPEVWADIVQHPPPHHPGQRAPDIGVPLVLFGDGRQLADGAGQIACGLAGQGAPDAQTLVGVRRR